jgi:hypothetical protein
LTCQACHEIHIMKAIEVKTKNTKYTVGVEKGVTSFIIMIKNTEDNTEVSTSLGSLSKENIKYEYQIEKLEPDDSIMIKVVDIFDTSLITEPHEIKDYNLDDESFLLQAKLKSYLGLKKELEENGMI